MKLAYAASFNWGLNESSFAFKVFRWIYEVTDPRHAPIALQSTSKPEQPHKEPQVYAESE
jgi:hypothetical protein